MDDDDASSITQDGWTAEFSVEWLRLVSLPFPHTRPLRNPLNDNLPIR